MVEKSEKIRCELGPQQSLRVVLYGLGAIGIGTGRLVLERENLRLVGAVDIDESKYGRDIHELMGRNGASGIKVKRTLAEVLSAVGGADVVLHTTGSYLKVIYPQLSEIVSAGVNVISSAEELLYPYLRNPKLADDLDALAKSKGVTVLGTGVNPGFVMDVLPLVLSGVCQRIDKIEVVRVVDVCTRRKALQKKVGAGLTVSEFEQKVAEGTFGHVGLMESLALLAAGMGWQLDSISETIEPATAKHDMDQIGIKKGYVTGIKQVGMGLRNGAAKIRLDLEISAGAENPRDCVMIYGTPDIKATISEGVAGDFATSAALVNAIPQVIDAKPGLAAMGGQVFPKYAPSVSLKSTFETKPS